MESGVRVFLTFSKFTDFTPVLLAKGRDEISIKPHNADPYTAFVANLISLFLFVSYKQPEFGFLYFLTLGAGLRIRYRYLVRLFASLLLNVLLFNP